jgi:hypothetical protein
MAALKNFLAELGIDFEELRDVVDNKNPAHA